MHFNKLKIADHFSVAGRGLIFVVSLRDNGYTDKRYISESEIPITVGDTIECDDKNYEVTVIEMSRTSRVIHESIGLIVKELAE